jgi:hypothetical protein
MKKAFLLAAILFAGCSNAGIGTAVAGVGIAGAALTVYCAAGGSGCSPALVAYGVLITTEATKDAVILESGSTTLATIQVIVANLNADLNQGRALAGLTPSQQAEVGAIVAAINALLPLVVALETPTAPTVTIPALSAKDKTAITKMRTRITAARAQAAASTGAVR